MKTPQSIDTQPWWKEPWPWIIMAGPFVALIGCAVTIGLAVKHFSGQAITEGGTRQGLVVKRVDTRAPVASPAAGIRSEGGSRVTDKQGGDQ